MEITVGSLSSFDTKPMQVVEAKGKRYLVCKIEAGIFCVEDKCSHADVKLSRGEIEGDEIICPAHGARFCLKSGAAMCMPAVVPIKSFPVSIDGQEVKITVL